MLLQYNISIAHTKRLKLTCYITDLAWYSYLQELRHFSLSGTSGSS